MLEVVVFSKLFFKNIENNFFFNIYIYYVFPTFLPHFNIT